MRRAVVFGATGFIGSALVDRLAVGGLETVRLGSEMDLSARSAPRALSSVLREGDLVFMAAVRTPVRDGADAAANVSMARAVAHASAQRCVEHVTYFSSDAVYARSEEPVTETTRPDPSDSYGQMHLDREEHLRASLGDLLIVRPTLVYGGRSGRLNYGIDRLCRDAHKTGRIKIIGRGEERRDHINVNDLVDLVKHLAAARTTGVVNAVSGVSTSYASLADAIVNASRENISIEHDPRHETIWHRSFDTTLLRQLAPAFYPREPQAGAAAQIRQLEAITNDERARP